MGFFDKLKNEAVSAVTGAVRQGQTETKTIVFADMPESLSAFKALPQAAMSDPFDTAALAVVAFCLFPADRELCYGMIDFLRGPRPMNGMDKQFIADRFKDKDYVPRSYFAGATPANDYMPTSPYSVSVHSDPHSYDTENTARLYVTSGGADSPRPVQLRLAKDGKWYLWEYSSVLSGIRAPESTNPWA